MYESNKYVPSAHTSESMGLKTGSCLNTYVRTNRRRLSENTVDIATFIMVHNHCKYQYSIAIIVKSNIEYQIYSHIRN
jgi:hypothetical protein